LSGRSDGSLVGWAVPDAWFELAQAANCTPSSHPEQSPVHVLAELGGAEPYLFEPLDHRD